MIELFSHSFFIITGKYHVQSAILPMSVYLAVLRIAIVVRIPVSGNPKTTENVTRLNWRATLYNLFTMATKKGLNSKFCWYVFRKSHKFQGIGLFRFGVLSHLLLGWRWKTLFLFSEAIANADKATRFIALFTNFHIWPAIRYNSHSNYLRYSRTLIIVTVDQ